MTIDQLKKEVLEEELEKAKQDLFIFDPVSYAKVKTELIINFEGTKNMHKHIETVYENDISQLLQKIKYEKNEYSLILAIADEIKDYIIVKGEKSCIHAKSYFLKRKNSLCAVEFISKWVGRKAKICIYHNHPLRIAAIPSNNDIISFCQDYRTKGFDNSEWDNCVKEYGIDMPKDFFYDDWGVITAFDFFSYKQFIESGHNISEIYQQNDANQKEASEKLEQYRINA